MYIFKIGSHEAQATSNSVARNDFDSLVGLCPPLSVGITSVHPRMWVCAIQGTDLKDLGAC